MPERKYPDLAHLPPAEYRVEAEKRRAKERGSHYDKQKYEENRERILALKKQRRLASQIDAARQKLERLEIERLAAEESKKFFSSQDNKGDGGTVESVCKEP